MSQSPSTLIDNQRDVVARALNIAPDLLRTGNTARLEAEWLRYMEKGVLLRLHVGRWRARSKLQYRDLGLLDPDALPEPKDGKKDSKKGKAKKEVATLLDLGQKTLLPRRYVTKWGNIESSARKKVQRNSHPTYWGPFVTAELLEKILPLLEADKATYFALLNEALHDWTGTQRELGLEYERAAVTAYGVLSRVAPEMVARVTQKVFVAQYVERILSELRSPDEIQASFLFDWDMEYIPLPSLLAEDRAKREVAIEARNLEAYRLQAEKDMVDAKSDAEWRMHQRVLRKAEEQKTEQLEGFLKICITQIKDLTYQTAVDVLGKIQEHQTLIPRSVVQLREAVDKIRALNFYNDAETTQMMNIIEQEIDRAPKERSIGMISQKLQAIAQLSRDDLLALGERPRSGRDLGVFDQPIVEITRQSRQTLGLLNEDDLTVPLVAGRQDRLFDAPLLATLEV